MDADELLASVAADIHADGDVSSAVQLLRTMDPCGPSTSGRMCAVDPPGVVGATGQALAVLVRSRGNG